MSFSWYKSNSLKRSENFTVPNPKAINPTQIEAETLVPETLTLKLSENGTITLEPWKHKSGFIRSSKVGPLPLKLGTVSFFVRAPTVITFSAAPGLPIV